MRPWRVDGGIRLTTFEGHTGRICAAAFRPDGRRVVTTRDADAIAEAFRRQIGRLFGEARANGVAVVAASAASQSSFEVPSLGHGLFTVAVLRALEGRATFEGGRRVGVANPVRYVRRHLPILSERYIQASQTPTYGLLGQDFTLALLQDDDPPLLAFDDVVRRGGRASAAFGRGRCEDPRPSSAGM